MPPHDWFRNWSFSFLLLSDRCTDWISVVFARCCLYVRLELFLPPSRPYRKMYVEWLSCCLREKIGRLESGQRGIFTRFAGRTKRKLLQRKPQYRDDLWISRRREESAGISGREQREFFDAVMRGILRHSQRASYTTHIRRAIREIETRNGGNVTMCSLIYSVRNATFKIAPGWKADYCFLDMKFQLTAARDSMLCMKQTFPL